MVWSKHKFAAFMLAVVVGLIAGALISELLQLILPTGVVRDFLTRSFNFGFSPSELNLGVVRLTFGINLSFTIVSLLVIVGVVYYFKWWL